MRQKNKKIMFMGCAMSCFFILGSLITSVCFINGDIIYRSFVTQAYDGVSGSMTEQEVLDLCNMTGDEYIGCLHDLFVSEVTPNASDCQKRGYISYSAMEVLNHGQGCCRDAAEYYSYFLDKKNISNQLVYVPMTEPEHIFVVATLMENNIIASYTILDFNIIWTVMTEG